MILSAQCTDQRVNQVTPALFQRFPHAAAYARASPEELAPFLRSLGLFRNKARNLVAMGRALLERHGGEVPRNRAELEQLPGVGRKTAGVVCLNLGGEPALPVDTHVRRVARRLGLSQEEKPEKVELDLERQLPMERWARAHQLLVWHGRRTCRARAPRCQACVVSKLCPKVGVALQERRAGAAARLQGASRFGRGGAL